MSYSVFWTPEAERTFNQNLEYLAREWDNQLLHSFLDRVEAVLEEIRQNPSLFTLYRQSEDLHRCILNERMILIHRIVDHQTIHLLTFWNTFQDPGKLKI